MSSETTFFDALGAIETGLGAHMTGTVGFEDVGVVIIATGETRWESVVLFRPLGPDTPPRVVVTQAWAALGAQRRDDTYTVPARVEVKRLHAESEAAFVAAGNRCEAITRQVVAYFRDPTNWPAVGDQVLAARVDAITYEVYVDNEGAWVIRADIDIDIRARVS